MIVGYYGAYVDEEDDDEKKSILTECGMIILVYFIT